MELLEEVRLKGHESVQEILLDQLVQESFRHCPIKEVDELLILNSINPSAILLMECILDLHSRDDDEVICGDIHTWYGVQILHSISRLRIFFKNSVNQTKENLLVLLEIHIDGIE